MQAVGPPPPCAARLYILLVVALGARGGVHLADCAAHALQTALEALSKRRLLAAAARRRLGRSLRAKLAVEARHRQARVARARLGLLEPLLARRVLGGLRVRLPLLALRERRPLLLKLRVLLPHLLGLLLITRLLLGEPRPVRVEHQKAAYEPGFPVRQFGMSRSNQRR